MKIGSESGKIFIMRCKFYLTMIMTVIMIWPTGLLRPKRLDSWSRAMVAT